MEKKRNSRQSRVPSSKSLRHTRMPSSTRSKSAKRHVIIRSGGDADGVYFSFVPLPSKPIRRPQNSPTPNPPKTPKTPRKTTWRKVHRKSVRRKQRNSHKIDDYSNEETPLDHEILYEKYALDAFWNMFTRIKFQECYLTQYKTKFETILAVVSGLCVIGTFLSISASIIVKAILWWVAIVVTAAQIVQALLPYSALHKKLVSINFMLPDLKRLLLNIEDTWYRISMTGEIPIEDITRKCVEYEKEYNELELKYLSDCNFESLSALFSKVKKSAQAEQENFFYITFGIKPEKSDDKGDDNENKSKT